MRKRLVVDSPECTGCDSCMLTCSFQHGRSFGLKKARIWIEKDNERADFTPRVCIQCDDATCVDSCSADALSRDESTGATIVDRETCTGCQTCVTACPFDGIRFDDTDGVPLICDLCGGEPACVKFCQFPLAIRFEQEIERGCWNV